MSANDMKPTSRTDWDRLAKMTDEEIDYSDIPPLTDDFFARAKLVLPNTVQLDSDVLAWFEQQGQDYPALINQVLREYIEIHDKAA